jgi:diacylglycerol kinase family enzyme
VGRGLLAAVVVKPIGTGGLLALALHGAIGELGESDSIVPFGVERLGVTPSRRYRTRRIKVATDGEVGRLDVPLRCRVSPEPLMLLTPAGPGADGACA